MSIKEIKETYPEAYEKSNKKAISWIVKNKKILKEEFKSKHPKSPFEFVAQFATKNGSLLINNFGEIRANNKVSFLSIKDLAKLGCPQE